MGSRTVLVSTTNSATGVFAPRGTPACWGLAERASSVHPTADDAIARTTSAVQIPRLDRLAGAESARPGGAFARDATITTRTSTRRAASRGLGHEPDARGPTQAR